MRVVTTTAIALWLSLGAAGCGAEAEETDDTTAGRTSAASTDEHAAADTDEADVVDPDAPSVDDSCEGRVSETGAIMECHGRQMLTCSQFTSYRWRERQVCPPGTRCSVSEDLLTGACR